MQTVQFQCGNCHKLMAVSVEHAGRQVRCPHCQQVVVAPTASPQPAAAHPAAQPVVAASEPSVGSSGSAPLSPEPPMFAMPEASTEAESIFAPPEELGADACGEAPAPQLEPPVPASPPPAIAALGTQDEPHPDYAAPPPPAPEVPVPPPLDITLPALGGPDTSAVSFSTAPADVNPLGPTQEYLAPRPGGGDFTELVSGGAAPPEASPWAAPAATEP